MTDGKVGHLYYVVKNIGLFDVICGLTFVTGAIKERKRGACWWRWQQRRMAGFFFFISSRWQGRYAEIRFKSAEPQRPTGAIRWRGRGTMASAEDESACSSNTILCRLFILWVCREWPIDQHNGQYQSDSKQQDVSLLCVCWALFFRIWNEIASSTFKNTKIQKYITTVAAAAIFGDVGGYSSSDGLTFNIGIRNAPVPDYIRHISQPSLGKWNIHTQGGMVLPPPAAAFSLFE